MGLSIREIVSVSLALIIMAIIYPIGLAYIGAAEDFVIYVNGTATTVADAVDATTLTLFQSIVPLMAVITAIMGFMPRLQGKL